MAKDKLSPPPPPPPPAESLTDAPKKKKPWSKPTIRISDGIIEVQVGSAPLTIEMGNDAYSPTS